MFSCLASRHARDIDSFGQVRPRYRKTKWRRTCQEVWFRGGLLRRYIDVVAKAQTQNVVPFWWTLLLKCCQGQYYSPFTKFMINLDNRPFSLFFKLRLITILSRNMLVTILFIVHYIYLQFFFYLRYLLSRCNYILVQN